MRLIRQKMNSSIPLRVRVLFAKLVFGAVIGHTRKRKRMACKWLQGKGLEIGALDRPVTMPPGIAVTYVDRMCNADLLQHYPELAGKTLVPVGLVDDGEVLASVEDASQDFLIANHLLEHCENPIGTVRAWLRVLKDGGIAYIAVPDKRFTFDYRRATTAWEHVLNDFRDGAASSREEHYRDWAKNVMGVKTPEIEAAVLRLMNRHYSIHFHNWSAKSLAYFFEACRTELGFSFAVGAFVRNVTEVIVILKKLPATSN